MTVAALEEFVFTDEMKDAIRAARFKTTNVPRTFAWIYDSDGELMRATGVQYRAFERQQSTRPGVFDDHEGHTANPEVVAFVGALLDKGRSKPAHNPATAAIPF